MSIVFELLLSAIPLSLKPIFLMNGLGKYFGQPAAGFLVSIAGTLLVLSLASPLLCFFYRYSVATSKTATVANNNRDARRCCSMSTLLFSIAFETLCAVTTFCISFRLTLTDQYHIRNKNLRSIQFLNSSQWQDRVLFALQVKAIGITRAIVPTMVIMITVASIILAVLIVRSLNSQRASMSATTFALQKRFTHALTIQVLYPIVLLSIPYLSMVLEVNFGILTSIGDITSAIPFISLACMASYPIINAIVTIYFVTPYRNVVVDTAKWLFEKSLHNRGGRRLSELLARKPILENSE